MKMSKKLENEFRYDFIETMRNAGFWIERIEKAKGMNDGFPDTVVLFSGEPFFIELKVGETNDDTFKCKEVRPSQFAWHRKFLAQGGKSFILCGEYSNWSKKWIGYPFTINQAKEYMNGVNQYNNPKSYWLDGNFPIYLHKYAQFDVNWAVEAIQ